MKSKRKALLLSVCAILLIVASVFGTLAYLTDTESALNTFTVGQVDMVLTETDVDKDGNNKANKYHLLPGHDYVKDPTIIVNVESETAYFRMIVTVNFPYALTEADLSTYRTTELDGLFVGRSENLWQLEEKIVSADGKTVTYEYRFFTTADGNTGSMPPLFQKISVPSTYDNEEIALFHGMTIDVEAHAIQAAGFADADEAWDAFDAQYAG